MMPYYSLFKESADSLSTFWFSWKNGLQLDTNPGTSRSRDFRAVIFCGSYSKQFPTSLLSPPMVLSCSMSSDFEMFFSEENVNEDRLHSIHLGSHPNGTKLVKVGWMHSLASSSSGGYSTSAQNGYLGDWLGCPMTCRGFSSKQLYCTNTSAQTITRLLFTFELNSSI